MTDALYGVRDRVIHCTACSLADGRKNAVPGSGNFRADVIFVGEAPGRNEDIQGIPFVGAAGRKLDLALYYAGISRESVYITNVVKCRPPGNRVPSKAEREACSRHFQDELEIVHPMIICILGNTALGSILGRGEITKCRGKIMRKGDRLYFATIHPAATIYQKELFGALKSDMERLADIITELKKGKQVPVDIECPS